MVTSEKLNVLSSHLLNPVGTFGENSSGPYLEHCTPPLTSFVVESQIDSNPMDIPRTWLTKYNSKSSNAYNWRWKSLSMSVNVWQVCVANAGTPYDEVGLIQLNIHIIEVELRGNRCWMIPSVQVVEDFWRNTQTFPEQADLNPDSCVHSMNVTGPDLLSLCHLVTLITIKEDDKVMTKNIQFLADGVFNAVFSSKSLVTPIGPSIPSE